jgi:hypothetical protein
MAWFADLSPCSYFGDEHATGLIAVGWLEADHEFPCGDVSAACVGRLHELFASPWQPLIFCGYHSCSLCPPGPRVPPGQLYRPAQPRGYRNLFVPATGFLYVTPELVLHYIAAHRYHPPAEFEDAVLACPPMETAAYMRAVRANAPATLLALLAPSQ